MRSWGVGTLVSVDPDRIVLKKILLTGYPTRVKRSSAVIKHMFYNPEDVKWFKVSKEACCHKVS